MRIYPNVIFSIIWDVNYRRNDKEKLKYDSFTNRFEKCAKEQIRYDGPKERRGDGGYYNNIECYTFVSRDGSTEMKFRNGILLITEAKTGLVLQSFKAPKEFGWADRFEFSISDYSPQSGFSTRACLTIG